MTGKNPQLIEHLESQFGEIESGWTPPEWVDPAIQIVKFRTGKIPSVTVLSTLGLSGFPLQSPVSAKQVRQELFVMVKEAHFDERLPPILDQVARQAARTNTAILRGDLIKKEGPIFLNRKFVALYATLPIYYPESFWSLNDKEQGNVVLCWLLPVKEEEVLYIQKNGWSGFEALLDAAQFDLFDLDRPTLAQ